MADYRFDGNYASSVAGAQEAFPSGTNAFASESVAGCQRPVLTFPANSGVAIKTKDLIGVGPTVGPYTIIALLRLELTPAEDYIRVINWFQSLQNDNGLYLHYGLLDFYDNNVDPLNHEGTAVIEANRYTEVAVTRDASKLITGYVNGVQQFTYTDALDQAVSPSYGNIYFFQDNGDEESAGAVARIRLYDSALSASQITNTIGCFAPQRCGGKAVTISGDDGPNVLLGTPLGDVIAGGGANDQIRGLGGNDTLCGNAGRDRLIGGKGRDRLIGAGGRDTCRGGRGRDVRRGCERGGG